MLHPITTRSPGTECTVVTAQLAYGARPGMGWRPCPPSMAAGWTAHGWRVRADVLDSLEPVAGLPVERVDAGRTAAHQRLVGPDGRRGQLSEHPRVPKAVDGKGPHRRRKPYVASSAINKVLMIALHHDERVVAVFTGGEPGDEEPMSLTRELSPQA